MSRKLRENLRVMMRYKIPNQLKFVCIKCKLILKKLEVMLYD